MYLTYDCVAVPEYVLVDNSLNNFKMTNKLFILTLFFQLFYAPFANAGSKHGSSSDNPSDKSSKLSPTYNYVFQFPVPIPPVIKPLRYVFSVYLLVYESFGYARS